MKMHPHANIVVYEMVPRRETESAWLAKQPYLALDPAKQPVFTREQILTAASEWAVWEESRKR